MSGDLLRDTAAAMREDPTVAFLADVFDQHAHLHDSHDCLHHPCAHIDAAHAYLRGDT